MDNLNSHHNDPDVGNPEAGPMECRRCGVCCTRHQAFVNPADIARIISYLEITMDDWERLYDDTRWQYSEYRMIRHVNGACAFLEYTDGLASCAIHLVKPGCCASWRPGLDREECREGIKKSGGSR